jgi:hypothetical protein
MSSEHNGRDTVIAALRNEVATLRAKLEECQGAIRSALAYLPNDAELAEMTDRDVRRALDGVWKPLHRALLSSEPAKVERLECPECGYHEVHAPTCSARNPPNPLYGPNALVERVECDVCAHKTDNLNLLDCPCRSCNPDDGASGGHYVSKP